MSDAKIAGQTIEQYELDQLIEQSDLSSTFLAFDSEANQPVLLKLLEGPFKTDEELRSGYLKRVKSLSRIRHPNVAAILDYGLTVDQQPYVVTEKIDGFPLSRRLDRLAQQESPAHVIYALTLVRQIASGLALAERLDFFHFALTPEHILLKNVTQGTNDAAVLVDLDFPLELSSRSGPAEDTYLAQYLSPEQLGGKPVDGRSHVYSLGVILFQLLSGQRPESNNRTWLVGRSSTSLQQYRSDLAPETYVLVDRATNGRLSKRFASVSEFLNALDQALDAEDLRIHTSNIAEPSRPWPIYFAPLLLLLLCILVAGAFWWRGPDTVPPDELMASSSSAGSSDLVAILLKPVSSPTPALAAAAITASPTAAATSVPASQTPLAAYPVVEATESPTVPPSPTATPTARTAEASAVPTETTTTILPPTLTEPAPTPQPQYRITVSSASLRRGPGTRYAVDSYLMEDDTVTVIARTTVGNVWFVVETSDGRTGWISAAVGRPDDNASLDEIAPAATIPPPPPTFTPTPSPTPLPSATPTDAAANNGGNAGGGNGGSDQGSRPRATPTPPL